MTCFVRDIKSSNLAVQREAQAAYDRVTAETDFTIVDGVMRWNSNSCVVPTEWYELANSLGLPADVEACDNASRAELASFLTGYQTAQANRSNEQRTEEQHEILAAFGPGAEVINIFTNEVIRS